MPCGITVDTGYVAVRFRGHRRITTISLLTDAEIKWQPRQQRHAQLSSNPSSAAFAEEVSFMATVRAAIKAHVFDNAEHRNIDLTKHLDAFAGIEQRDVLGVVTITAPETGTRCDNVNWISPVPGGMSTMR